MVSLAPQQFTAIREMHNGCILKGVVGSGKSRTALGYFISQVCLGQIHLDNTETVRPMQTPRDLYICTTAKKKDDLDWEEEAVSFALSTQREASYGGVKLTVFSWNKIAEYTHIEGACFFFDEQRLVGSGVWAQSFLKIAKKNHWIVLSATPGDNWSDYIPIFVANGYFKNRTAFVRDHVVFNKFSKFPKIDRYIDTNILERYRREIIVEMPYDRHTTRHSENIMVYHNKKDFDRVWDTRWNIYEDAPCKDIAEMFRVARILVNTDVSRMAAVMELADVHPRMIIFYNFNKELEMLLQLEKVLNITVAQWNGHKHQSLPTSDRWLYLVQYTAGAEGWNCTTTDTVVFWSLNYSYKIFEQCKGRIDRMNTPYTDLYYYILRSNSKIDTAITRSLALKKTFNEAEYMRE